MEPPEEYASPHDMNASQPGININTSLPRGLFESTSPFRFLSIRLLFGALYAVVFFGCICGNALVMFVIIRHQRMRNITNFFLANLAASDICVGVFCVIPNLMTYFTPYWYAGKVMCKLYFFIQAVSYTASIIILTVIALERYFAIIHPILSKRLSRMTLMRTVIVIVWLGAVGCGVPSLFQYDTVSITESQVRVEFCMFTGSPDVHHTYVLVNFALLYCLPLILIAAMYARVSVVLWKSSYRLRSGGGEGGGEGVSIRKRPNPPTPTSTLISTRLDETCVTEQSDVSNGSRRTDRSRERRDTETRKDSTVRISKTGLTKRVSTTSSNKNRNALTARRKVIRLLITIVGSFAACMLPHHVRLLYELWAPHKFPVSFLQCLIPPISFLLFYMNSALNPVLYAFLSDNFRNSLKELFGCRRKAPWMPGSDIKSTRDMKSTI